MGSVLEQDVIHHVCDTSSASHPAVPLASGHQLGPEFADPHEELEVYEEPGSAKPAGLQRASLIYATGLLHLVVHVWVFNGRGQVLLRRRAKDMDLFPDMWDVSASARVRPGEDTRAAAVRALQVCLGFSADEAAGLALSEDVPAAAAAAAASADGAGTSASARSQPAARVIHVKAGIQVLNQLVSTFVVQGYDAVPPLRLKPAVAGEAVFMDVDKVHEMALGSGGAAPTLCPWLVQDISGWSRGP